MARKRLIAAQCLAVVLLPSLAYAGYSIGIGARFAHPGVFRCSADSGPVWTCTTSAVGKVRIFDAEGRLIGTVGNEPPALLTFTHALADSPAVASSAQFEIAVGGVRATVVGPGSHPIRGPQGDLLGTVLVGPFDASEIEQMREQAENRMPRDFDAAVSWAQRRSAASDNLSDSSGNAYTTYGYYKPAAVGWFARGRARTLVSCSDGTHLAGSTSEMPGELQQTLNGYVLTPREIAEPRLAITARGATQTYSGYGRHLVHGANNIDVAIELQPLQTFSAPRLLQCLQTDEQPRLAPSGQNSFYTALPPVSGRTDLPAVDRADLDRLRAELKNYKPISQADTDKLRAELKNYKPMDQADMDKLRAELKSSRADRSAAVRQLTDQIKQQELNSPEMRKLQSPEFRENIRRQVFASPEMRDLQSPEFRQKLQQEVDAARRAPSSGDAPPSQPPQP